MADAPPAYSLWLEGWHPPTLNRTLRQHWSKVRKGRLDTAWRLRLALAGRMPPAPLARARVEIERRCWSGPLPDHDGLVGGCKGLIDCLLPMVEKRRPYGLGLVVDDRPDVMDLRVRAVRVPREQSGTHIVITPL